MTWVAQPLWIKDSTQLNFSSFIKWRDSIKVSDRHNNVGSQFECRRSKEIAKKNYLAFYSLPCFTTVQARLPPNPSELDPQVKNSPLNLSPPHPPHPPLHMPERGGSSASESGFNTTSWTNSTTHQSVSTKQTPHIVKEHYDQMHNALPQKWFFFRFERVFVSDSFIYL